MSKQENDDQAKKLAELENSVKEQSAKQADDEKASDIDNHSIDSAAKPTVDEAKPTVDKAKQARRTAAKARTPVKAEKQSNGVAWFAVLLSLTSIGLLSAGGYYGYQLHTQLQADRQKLQLAQAEQMQQLQTQLNTQVNTKITQVTSEIAQSQQQNVNNINKQLADNITTVNNKVAEISGRQPSDWAIAEANYLVRMAGRKLWLENDIETAQHLLATADLRIAELSNPALTPIRQAIIADITVVRALPQPRITDIHLSLSGLIAQLDKLPLNYVEEHHQPIKTQQPQIVSGDLADWQDNLTNSVSAWLSKLFYINTGTSEGGSEPYKMPRQQWFLRANVKHAWLQAQSAVLSRNQIVYQDSLKRSVQWLGHFKQTDSGVQAAITTLESLLNDQIIAQYPEKLQSQILLEKTLRTRLSTVPTVKPENTPTQKTEEQQPKPETQQQGQAL